jgi:hypothetical protein
MKKNIKLPAPMLSQLKEVNVDLDMRGRHYAEIATSDGQLPEEVALSIVNDLMDEDANKLTLNELRYIFMLIKINSLENDYKVTVTCTHEKKDGSICGHENVKQIKLSDADLNFPKKNYQPPVIKFIYGEEKKEKEWRVMPPTVDMECAVLNWFLAEKGIKREELLLDKKESFNFTYLRSVMHLVDEVTGERAVKDMTDFEAVLEGIDDNKYAVVHKLYELVEEVSQYGLTSKMYELTCKECGGKLVFHLPLLDGLAS